MSNGQSFNQDGGASDQLGKLHNRKVIIKLKACQLKLAKLGVHKKIWNASNLPKRGVVRASSVAFSGEV